MYYPADATLSSDVDIGFDGKEVIILCHIFFFHFPPFRCRSKETEIAIKGNFRPDLKLTVSHVAMVSYKQEMANVR